MSIWTRTMRVVMAGALGLTLLGSDTIRAEQSSSEVAVRYDSLWERDDIPVCWEDGGWDTSKGWVRDAIANTWEAVSPIRFTGWGRCFQGFPGIRIGIEDTGPHTKGLGNQLAGRFDGMVLNFSFNNWGEGCAIDRQFCIEAIAVHEFGHALGIAHEHNRSDRSEICTDDPQGTDGDYFVTSFDMDSVMNYCNPQWNGDGQLSALDIEGIQLLYGVEGARLRGFASSSYGPDATTSFAQGVGAGFWSAQRWLSGDVDGDGLDDVVLIYEAPDGQATANVYPATGDGLVLGSSERLGAGFWDAQHWELGDVTGDGREDLVLVYGASNGATAWIYESNGTSFARIASQRLGAGFWDGQRWELGDVTGDGREDLVLVYGASDGATAWIYRSNGSSFTRTASQRLGAGFWGAQRWELGDVTGDGREDLVLVYGASNGATAWIYRSNGSSFTRTASQRLGAGFWDAQRWELGDATGDGRADLVLVYAGPSSQATAWTYRSNGSSFTKIASRSLGLTDRPETRWLIGNFDGDHHDDLISVSEL